MTLSDPTGSITKRTGRLQADLSRSGGRLKSGHGSLVATGGKPMHQASATTLETRMLKLARRRSCWV